MAIAAVLMFQSLAAYSQEPAVDRKNETSVCKGDICAVSFLMESNQTGDATVAEQECKERGMYKADDTVVTAPVKLEATARVWSKSGGKHGTRIWMVLCEKR